MSFQKKIFWVSTVPRTGSTWVFNVLRELLIVAGKKIEPIIVPQTPNQNSNLFEKYLNDENLDYYLTLKTHEILKNDLPFSKIISTHRDPRDILISYMRFMKTDFETAFKVAKSLINYTNNYNSYNKDYNLLVSYFKIETEPLTIIKNICNFVDIEVSSEKINQIKDKFDKKNIKLKIMENDEKLKNKISTKQTINKNEVIFISKDNYRSYDPYTGFQSNHVSEGSSGDYKKTLTKKQINEVNSYFSKWFKEFGYEY